MAVRQYRYRASVPCRFPSSEASRSPAGKKIGVPNLGWHTFRHTYRSRLGDFGVAPEVQQKLMRHSSIDMTMKYGQNAMLKLTRPANARLVEELLATGPSAPLLRPQIL